MTSRPRSGNKFSRLHSPERLRCIRTFDGLLTSSRDNSSSVVNMDLFPGNALQRSSAAGSQCAAHAPRDAFLVRHSGGPLRLACAQSSPCARSGPRTGHPQCLRRRLAPYEGNGVLAPFSPEGGFDCRLWGSACRSAREPPEEKAIARGERRLVGSPQGTALLCARRGRPLRDRDLVAEENHGRELSLEHRGIRRRSLDHESSVALRFPPRRLLAFRRCGKRLLSAAALLHAARVPEEPRLRSAFPRALSRSCGWDRADAFGGALLLPCRRRISD